MCVYIWGGESNRRIIIIIIMTIFINGFTKPRKFINRKISNEYDYHFYIETI